MMPRVSPSAVHTTNLPPVPTSGTAVEPLLNADDIFQAGLAVIQSTRPGQNLFMSQYTLPSLTDGPSSGTPASEAQRQFLEAITQQIRFNNVRVYVVADSSDSRKPGGKPHNQETIDTLHQMGAYVLPYPKQTVNYNHTKFLANEDYAVIASANQSKHQSDAPDLNTGFLLAGAAAHNGIARAFLPQWNFAVREDKTGWAKDYPAPEVDTTLYPDEKVLWLSTAPKEESGGARDTTEILDAYRALVQKAEKVPGGYFYFAHFDLSNLDLVQDVLSAHGSNPSLDFRFLLDPNQYLEGVKAGEGDARVKAYKALHAAGIPIRFAFVSPNPRNLGSPQIFHNKYAVYGDEAVINGSANFSYNGLSGSGDPSLVHADVERWEEAGGVEGRLHNREVDVLVLEVDSARQYRARFEEDWNLRSTEDPEKAARGEGKPEEPVHPPEESSWACYQEYFLHYLEAVHALFPTFTARIHQGGTEPSRGLPAFDTSAIPRILLPFYLPFPYGFLAMMKQGVLAGGGFWR